MEVSEHEDARGGVSMSEDLGFKRSFTPEEDAAIEALVEARMSGYKEGLRKGVEMAGFALQVDVSDLIEVLEEVISNTD